MKPSVKYYNMLADWAEEHRWDCFHLKHELIDFISFAPISYDYLSLSMDVEEDLPPEFQAWQEPLTYDDCVNYFSGKPLCHGAGYHQSSVSHRRY